MPLTFLNQMTVSWHWQCLDRWQLFDIDSWQFTEPLGCHWQDLVWKHSSRKSNFQLIANIKLNSRASPPQMCLAKVATNNKVYWPVVRHSPLSSVSLQSLVTGPLALEWQKHGFYSRSFCLLFRTLVPYVRPLTLTSKVVTERPQSCPICEAFPPCLEDALYMSLGPT